MQVFTAVAFLSLIQAQAPQHTVFVVDKVTQIGTARVYGNTASAQEGEHHAAPVVMAEFLKKCPVVAFTKDREAAEFILETQPGSSSLTDQKGNVLYVSPAKTLKNMSKDVCGYISVH